MASLIIVAGAMTYDKIASSREKRRAQKESHNAVRFAELEKAHSEEQSRYKTNSEVQSSPLDSPPPYTESQTQSHSHSANLNSNNPFRDVAATERRSSESSESERRSESGLDGVDGVMQSGGGGVGKVKRKGFREKLWGRKRKEDAVVR